MLFNSIFLWLLPTVALLPVVIGGGNEGASNIQHPKKEGGAGERDAKDPP